MSTTTPDLHQWRAIGACEQLRFIIFQFMEARDIRNCRLVRRAWNEFIEQERDRLLFGPRFCHILTLHNYREKCKAMHSVSTRHYLGSFREAKPHIAYQVLYNVGVHQGVPVLSEGMPRKLVEKIRDALGKHDLCAIRSQHGKTRVVLVRSLRYNENDLLRFA